MRFGELETGHHKVRASIATVAGLLPEITEGDDVQSQISLQLKDQAERSVLWDAEQQAEDGFETYPEYDDSAYAVAHSLTKKELEKVQELGINKRYEPEAPIGYRMSDGRIAPIPPSALEEFQLGQESRRQGHEACKENDADGEGVLLDFVRSMASARLTFLLSWLLTVPACSGDVRRQSYQAQLRRSACCYRAR